MLDKQFIIGFMTTVILFLGGCSSKLISAPGITGRFIEESTGKPIAGVRVRYTNIGDRLSKESTTDGEGRFIFQPEFAYGYAGYPTSPVSLQVSLELLIRDKHNFSSAYHFVRNTDIDHATINTGDIRVNKVFLKQ
ncbi:carboxypeptidase-like regulatory domain-containing protein [Aphanothece sacrum]|uniref:Carboxypeptidase regulatory-like domain-containing protein n=1 Tax=Aphanothece sacrum FPU1 TaxID=1920663 RepID=A0A401IC00_APHSA|nr:carboxypeptidase-like regulatory domain-containing protein [Aphanothece sacrum]GBF78762.1 hypothetical protein AsFPU1_0151 [Aphanothece sacrum FPU1]GBF82994.1 TonB-dependent receptor plug domain protein [Aphanothece sacrum FPU3]